MPAQPLPASTVILLRDTDTTPEVLMLKRHGKSEFLPDVYVFPGGRVEDEDRALADRLAGLDAENTRKRLPQFDDEEARAFFVAAVRETFEESGILLARPRGTGELLGPDRTAELSHYRLDVQSGDHSFRDLVEREDLELAADRLSLHAHWITPEAVPHRFDTVFFCAVAPLGQIAAHDGVESTDHAWLRPEDALEKAGSGKIQMILPTTLNLRTVAGFRDSDDALASSRRRPVVAVLPRVEEREGQRVLSIPPEAGYDISEESVPEAPRKR